MNEDDPLRKCNRCKILKPKSVFYRYGHCKKCHIKSYINKHLDIARTANILNLSIDEINNIINNDINDPTRNLIGEHERHDEIMMYLTGWNLSSSTIITNDIIDNFLNE